MTSPTNEQQRVVGWFCDRDGKTALTSGFVAENRAYVDAHKDCNWKPLLHPDTVAELIEAARGMEKAVREETEHLRSHDFANIAQCDEQKKFESRVIEATDRLRATLANVGSQP